MLESKLPEVREFVKEFLDAQLKPDADSFPPIRRAKPPKWGRDDSRVPSRISVLVSAATAPLRQLRVPRELSREHPETEIPARDAKWYRIARYDSAVVSMPDGTASALYRRDPRHYRELLRRTTDIHMRLYRDWDRLARFYRERLGEVTSPEAWEKTFGLGDSGD